MLSFSAFFLAGLMATALWLGRQQHRQPAWSVGAGIGAVALVAGIFSWPGTLIMQRGVTALLMPIGLVWLSLIALTFWVWRRSEPKLGSGLVVVLIILTLGGNRAMSKLTFDWLEGDYQRMNALDGKKYDVVFLLGGGAGRGPEGQLNVSSSGDRIVLAARLYHSGQARSVVCSGKTAGDYWPADRDPGRMSFQLLRELAVPPEALALLSGRNTKEEMREIRSYLSSNQVASVGVVTSSWHMRRALRLARAEGLKLAPLPCDFRGGEVSWRDYSFIPESGALADTGLAIKEMIAGIVGR